MRLARFARPTRRLPACDPQPARSLSRGRVRQCIALEAAPRSRRVPPILTRLGGPFPGALGPAGLVRHLAFRLAHIARPRSRVPRGFEVFLDHHPRYRPHKRDQGFPGWRPVDEAVGQSMSPSAGFGLSLADTPNCSWQHAEARRRVPIYCPKVLPLVAALPDDVAARFRLGEGADRAGQAEKGRHSVTAGLSDPLPDSAAPARNRWWAPPALQPPGHRRAMPISNAPDHAFRWSPKLPRRIYARTAGTNGRPAR